MSPSAARSGRSTLPAVAGQVGTPLVEAVIEIPRGSFLKRGSTGAIDFVSPLPCPVNYGAVPDRIGLEGDLLDAVVLGPRIAYGTRVRVFAWGAVGLGERGLYDDKLICSTHPVPRWKRATVVGFFHAYSIGKRLFNLCRGRSPEGRCHGWSDARAALARSYQATGLMRDST